MDILEHLNQMRYFSLYSQILLVINQLPFTNVNEGLFWPLSKPINGGTINERREHSQSSSEQISERTHHNNHMNISLNSY